MPAHLPNVPRDRFADGPLRLERTADGLVIYSLGTNREDDGGDMGEDALDVGFRLWDPEKRRRKRKVKSARERAEERAAIGALLNEGLEEINGGERELSSDSLQEILDEAREEVERERDSGSDES